MKPAFVGETCEYLGGRDETGIVDFFLQQLSKTEIGFRSSARPVGKV